MIIVCLIVVCERLSMRGFRGFDPQLKIYWTAADTEASIPLHAYFWYGHVRVPLTRRSKNRSERKPSSPDRIKPACKARVVFWLFFIERARQTREGERRPPATKALFYVFHDI